MPVYERMLKSGKLVFDVAVSQGGKTVWRRGFTSITQANRVDTKLKAERNQGVNISVTNLTVEEFLEQWLENYASTLGVATSYTYGLNLRTHIIPTLGRIKLKDLKATDVQACYTRILRTPRKGPTDKPARYRSPKTALNVHRVFREALQYAVRYELIHRNVCDTVQAPRATKHLVAPPSVRGLQTLLEVTDQTPYAMMVRTCLWTGLRQGELLRLRWSDIDFDRRLLYVREAKWGSAGTVVLSPEICSLLATHGEGRNSEFVFADGHDAAIGAWKLKRDWRAIKAKTGLRFHDLRHAHASLLIAAGAHPKVIQERLRHKQVSTTMDIYGHLMPGLQEQAAQSIDTALASFK